MFGRKKNEGETTKPEAELNPIDLVAPLTKPIVSRPATPPPPPAAPRPPVMPPRLGSGEPATPGYSPLNLSSPSPVNAMPAAPQSPSTPRAAAEPFKRTPETPAAKPETAMRQLIVGPDISLNGEINSCDRLLVEGNVEATLTNCKQLEVAESGLFKGSATADDTEIRGRFDGTLSVKGRILIRATGRVTGTVRYGQIEIECGGRISGDIQADDQIAAAAPSMLQGESFNGSSNTQTVLPVSPLQFN